MFRLLFCKTFSNFIVEKMLRTECQKDILTASGLIVPIEKIPTVSSIPIASVEGGTGRNQYLHLKYKPEGHSIHFSYLPRLAYPMRFLFQPGLRNLDDVKVLLHLRCHYQHLKSPRQGEHTF